MITFEKKRHNAVIAAPNFDSRDYMHLAKKKNISKFAKTEMSDENEKEEINLRGEFYELIVDMDDTRDKISPTFLIKEKRIENDASSEKKELMINQEEWIDDYLDQNKKSNMNSFRSDNSISMSSSNVRHLPNTNIPMAKQISEDKKIKPINAAKFFKFSTNIEKAEKEPEKQSIIAAKWYGLLKGSELIFRLKGIGKSFRKKNKVVVTNTTKTPSNPLQRVSPNLINKVLLQGFFKPLQKKEEQNKFEELDDYLLDNKEETKKTQKDTRNEKSVDSMMPSDEDDSMSNSDKIKNKIRVPSVHKRQAIKFKGILIVTCRAKHSNSI